MADNVTRLDDYTKSAPSSRTAGLKGGGGGGTFDDMEARVSRLEKGLDQIDAKLDRIVTDVAEMKGRLSALPDARSFGVLEGRLNSLPTLANLATLMAIGVGALTAAIHLRTILGWFGITF